MKLIKVVLLLVFAIFIACFPEPRMEECGVKDCGRTQIGDNIYLKKLYIDRGTLYNRDRIYLLVDSTDKLISNTSKIDIQDGKVQSTKTFIVK